MSEATPARPPALTIFLDLPGDESDPRTLLGLPEDNVERGVVLNALRSRLAQVAAHRLGGSPEASEVRILLHAAAARLLMPLASVSPIRTPLAHARAESAAAELDVASRAEFERGAMLILGQYGGLSIEAMQALRMLALSHGVPAEQVVPEVMTMLGGRGVTTPEVPRPERVHRHVGPGQRRSEAEARRAAQAVREEPGASEAELVEPQVLGGQVDPGMVFLRRVFIGAGVFIVVLLAGAAGLYFLTAGKQPGSAGNTASTNGVAQASTDPAGVTPGERRAETAVVKQPEPEAPVAPAESLDALVQGVRDAGVQLDAAPEAAMKRFESIVSALSVRWAEATPAQGVAMVDACMEFVYRASSGADRAQRAIGALIGPIDLLAPRGRWTDADVRSSCFGAGMLARLLRERDLPSSILEDLHRRGRPTFGDASTLDGTFHAGVKAAVGRLPGLLLGDDAEGVVQVEPAAWDGYAACVLSAMQRDTALRQQVLLGALERVVLSAHDPHQDAAVLSAERALAGAVGFGAGSPARERLVQWLARADVSNSDLHTITAAVLDAGQNSELDITMVVSLSATELDRAELRSRYESAWGVAGAVAPREYAAKWVERAKNELSNGSAGAGAMEHLVQATRLSTLNSAAMRLNDGDASTVDSLVQSDAVGVKLETRQSNTWYVISGSSDGSWAARYLAAGQDISKRRELLAQCNIDPTPVDGAVLVMEATRGAPSQVRAEARRVLAKYTTHPNVLGALLDFASFIPPTKENSAIVESVLGERMPTARSPAWRVWVRRSLVRRMLELVSTDENGFVDLAADHIRRQYDDALASWNGTPKSVKGGSAAPRTTIAEDAAEVRERLASDAKKIVVAPTGVAGATEVLARLQERRGRAEGDIQMFVAEQTACAELLALLTASERPARTRDIAAVLDDFDQERRSAAHVFEQVHAGERAVCRLWVLRLGGEP